MPDFKITWDTGLETTEHRSDCQTVEQFINSRFGAGVVPTAKVELVDVKVVEEPKVEVVEEPKVEVVEEPKVEVVAEKPKAKVAAKA